ncbi:MAG: DNA-3-methyladenine glycosylase 2 family protein [Betaproteobacteria bacterium]|nr:MAG: DNA-3-methyladenine glycosylase 2 family protein [Betaproteobacteria bacterium]
MTTTLACRIKLPKGFRQSDVLAFHRRDNERIAERVNGRGLQKGLAWNGCPAQLSLRFSAGSVAVDLAIDGRAGADTNASMKKMARRMLGLTQRVEAFEKAYHAHPQIGFLVERNAGLRVPLAPTPFEALAWAITGQQISVSAAVSVRRKLIRAVGLQHSSGLWCFPEAGQIVDMTEAELRSLGFSKSKALTLLALSRLIEDGALPLERWLDAPQENEIREQLLSIRGIGPWTVSYALLRGFGCLDGSLHGDVAVRRNLQVLLSRKSKVGEAEAQAWLAEFSPWRALVAAHLWAMQKKESY